MGSSPTPRTTREPPAYWIEFGFWLRNRGYQSWRKRRAYSDSTIESKIKILKTIATKASLQDTETVDRLIDTSDWSEGRKQNATFAYLDYCRWKCLSYIPKSYAKTQKLPYIPSEEDINVLISNASPSYATLLQLVKETAFRVGEALRLKWTDVDFGRRIVTLNKPEKNSEARQRKISEQLVSMLVQLPRQGDKIWSTTSDSANWSLQRIKKRVSRKLCKPSLMLITFKTLRHWKATMEYHKTKDILYVKELLGHKDIKNTLIYTHLVDWKSEDYVCKVAKTIPEATQLIEAGFDYVTEMDGVKMFRKRK